MELKYSKGAWVNEFTTTNNTKDDSYGITSN